MQIFDATKKVESEKKQLFMEQRLDDSDGNRQTACLSSKMIPKRKYRLGKYIQEINRFYKYF